MIQESDPSQSVNQYEEDNTGIGKKRGSLLSYSQAEPGRELTQPSPSLLAEPCTVPLSHLSTTLPEIGRRPLPAKRLNHAT